jgi:hypothetical protein
MVTLNVSAFPGKVAVKWIAGHKPNLVYRCQAEDGG